MPKTVFTQEEIDDIFKEKKEARRFYYDKAIEIADKMKVHSDGLYPKVLLEERRPNEPLEVKEYREKIWIAKTKSTFSKVFSSLQKIRRSEDWSVRFEGLDEFTLVANEEDLENYTELNFPYFTSVTNWVFKLLLRKYLIDPNAVIIVMPLEFEIPDNEYLRPFPIVFDSVDVIDYRENDYAILNNPLGATYFVNNTEIEGRSYFIVTTKEILRYDQIDGRNNFALRLQYEHGLSVFPGVSVKGLIIGQTDNQFLFEQCIAGMIPELDEAVREYSDLQAAKVLHIYPERWEYTNTECKNCNGTSRRPNPNWTTDCNCEPTIPCDNPHCRNGYVVSGPYSKIMIKPPSSLEPGSQIPNPPAGYVQKDVEIVKIMDQSVDAHIYKALAANNFQFLEKVPLAESGISKEVDKDELNNSVHSIAEDIISNMDSLYRIIAYYRYKELYSFDDIELMLPTIPVPEKFDILSPQHLGEELATAKTNNLNPVIRNAMEVDYATKRFNADQSVRDKVQLILELDPLPNISEDDKMTRLSNKGISLETYVISSNIQEFVQRALDEDPEFADKLLKEQKAVMLKFAKEQTEAITAEKQAMMEDMNMGGLNELPQNGQPQDKKPANAPIQ